MNHQDRPQIWQGQMTLMRNKDSGPQSADEQMLVWAETLQKASTATAIGSTRGATRSSEIGSTWRSWQVREGCGQRCRSGLTQHSDVSDHRWGGSARQRFSLHCARHSACTAAEGGAAATSSTPRASSRRTHSAQGQRVHCSARCLRVSAPATTHGIDAGVHLNKEVTCECGRGAAAPVAVTRSQLSV